MRAFRWCWARWKRLLALAVIVPLVLVNALAYLHARSFTHYAAAAATARPPSLTGWKKLGVVLTGVTLPRPENQTTPAAVGLAFTTHTITVADGSLEAWHVATVSPRALAILFHGRGGCKCGVLNEAAAFHELGYDTFLVDFRGGGGSSGSDCTLGVREGKDVAAALSYARAQWPGRRVVLYGQSMGSAAILRAIAHHGAAPDAIVLECPFDRLRTTVGHRFEAMGLPSFPLAEMLVFWGGVQHGFNAFAHNPVDDAAAVPCPALVLTGAHDTWVRPAEAKAVCAALGGRQRFELFAEARHQPCLGSDAGRWKRTVIEFLTENLR
jgi:alpha-beta hydrolase superfamily lysophospholipase